MRVKCSEVLFFPPPDYQRGLLLLRRREVEPDYGYRVSEPFKRNQLSRLSAPIELSRLCHPLQEFRCYFDSNKLRGLKEELKKFLGQDPFGNELPWDFWGGIDSEREREEELEVARLASKDLKTAQFLRNSRYIQKVGDIARLLSYRASNNSTVNEASRALRIPFNRATYLLREARMTNAESLLRTWEKVEIEGRLHQLFQDRLAAFLQDNLMKTKPLKVIHVAFAAENTDLPELSFQGFYRLCKLFDFRFKALQYQQPFIERWSIEQKSFALFLSFELFANVQTFDVLWVDETTVCPGNFQKKGWGIKGNQLVIESKLRYDSLKVLGVMSREKVVAVQFLHDSNNHLTFDYFLIEAIRGHLFSKADRSIPVIFFDNANIHKSKELLAFCRKNRIQLVFNLAYCPVLNPIELLWRFLKQPFKRMIDSYGR